MMSFLPSLKFRPEFAPIAGFIGSNGAGKSALAQWFVLDQAARMGVPVWSNIALSHPDVETLRFTGLADVSKIEHAILLLDDVSAVAPARETGSAPADLVMRLLAMRHRDAVLVWTSPTMGDVDIKIRQVTQAVTALRPLWRRRVPGQLWPNTTLSYARAYDTTSEHVTDVNRDTPLRGHGLVRLSQLGLEHYDTREELQLMADHAFCPDCGLRRRREYCSGRHPKPASPTPGSIPIASSNAPEVQAVKPPGVTPLAFAGAERVPGPQSALGLDGLDVGQ